MAHDSDDDRLRPASPPRDKLVSELAARRYAEAQSDDDHSEDEDSLFDELENDDSTLQHYREQRLEALKAELDRVNDMRESDHGRYTEMIDEKEVIRTSATADRCVIHFFHRDFRRCQVMDKHLETIASRHFRTRFLRVSVENVPWLVEKLQIKVLPCVVSFVKGVSKDRLIGFEELGNSDSFTTTALELRLAQTDVITLQSSKPKVGSSSSKSGPAASVDEDWDYDY